MKDYPNMHDPISRGLSGGTINNNLSSLQTQQHQIPPLLLQEIQMTSSSSHFDTNEFLEQMLSSSFPWTDDQHQLLLSRTNGLMPDHNDVVHGSSFKSFNPANDASVKAPFNGFTGSMPQTQSQHFHQSQGGALPPTNQPAASGGGGAPRQRVRARRGQATDPHSIAERLRRERIAERMKGLQELVPKANKTDKASMLDEIIDYVKFLQLQVKVLSVSRLGGASAIAPRVAEGKCGNGTQTTFSPNNNDGLTVTEKQVAKLMEEDMGSAMQYLQGKGLCLMPISLATAISSATVNTNGGPTSPSMSGLTVQSVTVSGNGSGDPSYKHGNSVSNP